MPKRAILAIKRKEAKTQREDFFAPLPLCVKFICHTNYARCLFLLFPIFCFSSPFGKDADLVNRQPRKSIAYTATGPGVSIGRTLIRFHQEVVTPIDGPRSHYLPSSSQYTLDGIEKYGFFKGWILGCDRLLRENDEAWIYPTCINERGERFKSDPVR